MFVIPNHLQGPGARNPTNLESLAVKLSHVTQEIPLTVTQNALQPLLSYKTTINKVINNAQVLLV